MQNTTDREYRIQEGVICTLDHPDNFYEGAYENQVRFLPRCETPWHAWPLWLIKSGYVWTVRRFVPAGATVVELGCAGGARYFGERYHAVGCGLSFSSLKKSDWYRCVNILVIGKFYAEGFALHIAETLVGMVMMCVVSNPVCARVGLAGSLDIDSIRWSE